MFGLFLVIRLGLRNLPRLILAQTFGHFRQRVTHQALPTAKVRSEVFGGLHPAGCDLDSHEVLGFVSIHQTSVKKQTTFDSGSNVWSLPAESDPPSAAGSPIKKSEVFGGLHPAGCDLDSHEVFGLFLVIRLGLRNPPRLILAQTFGHFRQRVTHEALLAAP